MKEIILAGGGEPVYPLTMIISKGLVSANNSSMIYYHLSILNLLR